MKFLIKLKIFKIICILFFPLILLGGFLPGVSFAKTGIHVIADSCEIGVMWNKQFYIIRTEDRNKWIEEINKDIDELDKGIQAAEALFSAGNPIPGYDMPASQQLVADGKKRLEEIKKRKKELEDASAEEAARAEGVPMFEIIERFDKWKREAENMWNGAAPYKYNCCRVRFIYNYIIKDDASPARGGYDQIGVHIGKDFRSRFTGVVFDDGRFSNQPFKSDMEGEFAFDSTDNYDIPHEAGHELGIDDFYTERVLEDGTIEFGEEAGHEHDLMAADPDAGGTPLSIGADGVTKIDHIATFLEKRNILCSIMMCCPPPGPEPDEVREEPGDHVGAPPGDHVEPPPGDHVEAPPEDHVGPPSGDYVEPSQGDYTETPPGDHIGAPPGDHVEPPPGDHTPDETGIIIVKRCVKNKAFIKIYDLNGVPSDLISADSLKNNSDALRNMLQQAKRDGGGQWAHGADKPDPAFDEGGDIIAIDKGITDQDLGAVADALKQALVDGKPCDKVCDFVKEGPGVDFIEKIVERDVQVEADQIIPNDPFYLEVGAYKKKDKTILRMLPKVGTDLSDSGVYADTKKDVIHDQWGLHAIGFTPRSDPNSAWNLVDADKKNIVVAVIDSGLDIIQPDGPRYLWTNPGEIPDNGLDDDNNGYIDDVHGWNFLADNNDMIDYKGHGTFVAGIIAAKSNNRIAIAGVNPGAQIMILKVVDAKGKTDNLSIYRALRYAADNGARVINISLNGRGVSKLEQIGINHAYKKGCVVVVAAGNQSADISEYGPSASRRAIVVSAAEPGGKRMWFSNIGANVGLTAPGRYICSLYSKDSEWTGPTAKKANLCFMQDGTSFSAPYVAGVASLLLAQDPKLSNKDVEDILLYTAKDLEKEGWDQYTGAGLLDASQALSTKEKNMLIVRFTDIKIRREEGNYVSSIDLFGVIRGNIKSYVVELSKGKKSENWEEIFKSSKLTDESGFVCSIDGGKVKNGKEWSVRITALDKKGNLKIARMWFSLEK